jgi:hypothetical protein
MAYAVMVATPRPKIIAIGSTGKETLELVIDAIKCDEPINDDFLSFLKACRVSLNSLAPVAVDFRGMTMYVQNVL